ncbi:GFA family protein [soil metagenome]
MTKKAFHGSCHCGAVTFEAKIDLDKGTTRCNCSICTKSRFWFAIVPPEDFEVKKGEDQLNDYAWIPPGKSESHLRYRFCRTCGVRIFAEGNEAKFYAVSIAALDGIEQDADQLVSTLKYNDGRHDDLKHAPTDTRLL